MKKPVSPHMVASLILGLIAPLSAQNLTSSLHSVDSGLKADGIHGSASRFSGASAMPGSYEVPALEKAEGDLSDDSAVFSPQDAATLNEKAISGTRDVGSVVDLRARIL